MNIVKFISFLIVTLWLPKLHYAVGIEAPLRKCSSKPAVWIRLGTGPDGKPFFLDVALPTVPEAPSTSTTTSTPDTKTNFTTTPQPSNNTLNGTTDPGRSVSKAQFSGLSVAIPLVLFILLCAFGAFLFYKKKMAAVVAPIRAVGTPRPLSCVSGPEYERSISQQYLTANDATAYEVCSGKTPGVPSVHGTLDADIEAAIPQMTVAEEKSKKKKKKRKKKKKKEIPEYDRSISQQQLVSDPPGSDERTNNEPGQSTFIRPSSGPLNEVCVPWKDSPPQTNLGFQEESSL